MSNEWTELRLKVYCNQFLLPLIWGGLAKLSEEDKKAFLNEDIIGVPLYRHLIDERKHSVTGIESYLINKKVNEEYSYLMPKISIGTGDGNDLLEGDIGIDLNPTNEKVIKADATTYDYSKHKDIKTISFPYSLHSMPLEGLLPKLKGFDNFIITLPYNGPRKEYLIEQLLSVVGTKKRETLEVKVRYTYDDGSQKIKKVKADILVPIDKDYKVNIPGEKKMEVIKPEAPKTPAKTFHVSPDKFKDPTKRSWAERYSNKK
jgi:hypothetical protein